MIHSHKGELNHCHSKFHDISRWEAVGQHDPPYSREEELKVVEVKKKDPPSADEVVFIVIIISCCH